MHLCVPCIAYMPRKSNEKVLKYYFLRTPAAIFVVVKLELNHFFTPGIYEQSTRKCVMGYL